MKKANSATERTGHRQWVAAGILGLALAAVANGDSIHSSGQLGAVEYRALLAQSLTQQVDELKAEAAELRKQIEERDRKLREAYDDLAQSRKEADKLRKTIAESEKEMQQREQLLSVFRRGSFEYYEVSPGDTLDSIAANPMVYGDATRATWIRQANTLPDQELLVPGMVLIIPRFPDGISYDL